MLLLVICISSYIPVLSSSTIPIIGCAFYCSAHPPISAHSLHLSLYFSVPVLICQYVSCTYLSVSVPILISLYMSLYLSLSMCPCTSVTVPMLAYIYLSISVPILVSLYMFLYYSVHALISLYLSRCLSVCICPCTYLSLCSSVCTCPCNCVYVGGFTLKLLTLLILEMLQIL